MGSTFTELVIDAHDPARLADFWTTVLGWDRIAEEDREIEIGAPGGQKPTLLFVPVDDPRTVKNRVHIDVSPMGCDQATELERLLGLGARRVDINRSRTNRDSSANWSSGRERGRSGTQTFARPWLAYGTKSVLR